VRKGISWIEFRDSLFALERLWLEHWLRYMTGYYGGLCAALRLVGQFVVNTNTVKAVIVRFVSVSNTETECHVHLLPQLTLNEHKYEECSHLSGHKDSCAVIGSSELCICCGIM
jgi:hypothetical protein